MIANSRILSFIAAALLGLTFIFYIVSNAVPAWTKVGNDAISRTYGLWKACFSTLGTTQCTNIQCPADIDPNGYCSKISAARAFVTLACIFSGISTLCIIAIAIIDQSKTRILLLATKILVVVCLVMGIIGVAIGISANINIYKGLSFTITTAGIIGILAIILNFFGGLITVFIRGTV